MHPETKVVRSALTPAAPGEPLHAGPVFATAFHTPGDPARSAYSYARSHNPTWTALETALAEMEHEEAGARVFGSGLAAVTSVFAVTLRPGDVVVMPDDVYFGARQVVEERFVPYGVQLRVVPAERLGEPEVLHGARLVWVETPANPRLTITDIAAVAEAAKRCGMLLAVDNTTATPFAQKPLELGADFSVCSDSKSMCGHSDLLLGHVATRDADWLLKIDRQRTLSGAVAGPMEAWLALRSLPTLALRLERSAANALALATMLSEQAEVRPGFVREVLYPGLDGHPGHEVASRQMSLFGAVLSFTLASQDAAERFLAGSRLLTEATSFGGVTSSAERRGRWGHDAIAPGLIRVSVGCEHVDDLLADVAQALDGAA